MCLIYLSQGYSTKTTQLEPVFIQCQPGRMLSMIHVSSWPKYFKLCFFLQRSQLSDRWFSWKYKASQFFQVHDMQGNLLIKLIYTRTHELQLTNTPKSFFLFVCFDTINQDVCKLTCKSDIICRGFSKISKYGRIRPGSLHLSLLFPSVEANGENLESINAKINAISIYLTWLEVEKYTFNICKPSLLETSRRSQNYSFRFWLKEEKNKQTQKH